MVGNGDGVGRLMVAIGCRERHETGGRDEERSSRSGLVDTRKESESVWALTHWRGRDGTDQDVEKEQDGEEVFRTGQGTEKRAREYICWRM